MFLRRIAGVLVVCCAAACAAQRADAQCAGGYGGCGYGGYWDIGRLYSVLSQNVPYYAAFPPVYYSYPVPRTYGYSPFAYPPGVMTPEVEAVQPLAIDNPYVDDAPQQAGAAPAAPPQADRTTQTDTPGRPLVVVNPFVQAANLAASR